MPLDTIDEAFERLAIGEVDVVVSDNIVGTLLLKAKSTEAAESGLSRNPWTVLCCLPTCTRGIHNSFSDSTPPAPVTDGKHVWFFNASGRITWFDMDGQILWERNWKPIEDLGGCSLPV